MAMKEVEMVEEEKLKIDNVYQYNFILILNRIKMKENLIAHIHLTEKIIH